MRDSSYCNAGRLHARNARLWGYRNLRKRAWAGSATWGNWVSGMRHLGELGERDGGGPPVGGRWG